MKTSAYWIIDTTSNIEANESIGIVPVKVQNETEYFYGCIIRQIDGKAYLLAPLEEVARVNKIDVSDFMDDLFLDVLNKLKQKKGIFPIISITDDV